MIKSTKRVLICAGAGLAMSLAAVEAPAALLTLDRSDRVSAVMAAPGIDLTTVGSTDWAYWAPASATGLTTPVAPTNSKVGGTAISDLSNVGGSTLRGSTTASTVARYNWTDGTGPASGSNASLAGLIFNSDLGSNAPTKGVSLTITGDPAVETGVILYLGAFAATANLSASLNGATSVGDSQVFVNSGPKHMQFYVLRFRPDNPGDVLTVQWTASAVSDATNGHVGLQAVAVAVPEPGLAATGAAAIGLLARRRRRTASPG